jgi:hypothetical protein
MFASCVFVFLMLMLFLSGGAAIHMGVFKSHRPGASSARKFIGGVVSYGFSGVFWFFCYSHHYLGW